MIYSGMLNFPSSGVLGVLDRLHGTDSQFRRTRAYSRHVMFFGLTPLSVQIPDETKIINGKSRSPSPTKEPSPSPNSNVKLKETINITKRVDATTTKM